MNKPRLSRILFLFLTSFLIGSNAMYGQGCVSPSTITKSYTWAKGVTVYASLYNFPSTTPLTNTMTNWNNGLSNYFTGCGSDIVKIVWGSGGPYNMNVNYTPIPKNGTSTIRGQTHLDAAIFDGTNRLEHVDIDIDTGVTNGATITEVYAHELGHTFALNDCNGCATGSSVMVAAVTIPSENTQIGTQGPTTCDLLSVSHVATDYACQVSCGAPASCPRLCYPECGGICQCSPIVVDPFHAGFHLTSLSDGVHFRVDPKGPKQLMSWTETNSGNGWLALDRDGNGQIDDFTELFGSLSPQPPDSTPNGFLALAVFDRPDNGGNGNGEIDPGDAVYDSLRVWIDANHNGISEPEELHTLSELGIFKVSLRYTKEGYTDENGNVFRLKGHLLETGHDNTCYDVLLQVLAEEQ